MNTPTDNQVSPDVLLAKLEAMEERLDRVEIANNARQDSTSQLRQELNMHARSDAEIFGRLDERMTWMFRVLGGIAFLVVLGFTVLGYMQAQNGRNEKTEQRQMNSIARPEVHYAISTDCQWRCSNFCGHFQSTGCWSYCVTVLCGE